MTTAYATYSYYTTTYLGTAIASADFAALALRASAVIDQVTYDRAAAIIAAGTPTTSVTAIEMATCAMAEQLQVIEASGISGGIKSESIGNNSVTYMDGTFATLSTTAKLKQVAKLYLGSTGLMYAGFASGEYGGEFDAD